MFAVKLEPLASYTPSPLRALQGNCWLEVSRLAGRAGKRQKHALGHPLAALGRSGVLSADGGTPGFYSLNFLVEHLTLGLTASLAAIIIAQPAAWLLCRHGLDLVGYRPFWLASLALAYSLKEQSEE